MPRREKQAILFWARAQAVVDDYVRAPEAFRPFDGEQTRIAWASANEVDRAHFGSRFAHRVTPCMRSPAPWSSSSA